jgi:hypothetical protein
LVSNPLGTQPEPFSIKNVTNGYPVVVTFVEQPSSMLGDDSELSLLEEAILATSFVVEVEDIFLSVPRSINSLPFPLCDRLS